MRKKGKSSIKAAARRAAKAATPPKKRKDSGAPGSSRTRYVRDFDGQVFEFVDLNYPPPLTGDPPQLAWPRIHMGMWPDPNLTHWPTEEIVQRLATFNLHAEPEMFRRLVEEYRSGDAVLKNWPTPELERGDAWDDFPVWAMQALLRRWAADIPNIDVLGEKLRDSPDELWTGEDLGEGAAFLLEWLQEAVQLLEVVPASQRADVWKGLQGAADTDLDVFLPNWWDTLAQRDPEALLAMRPVLSEVLVDPGELLTTLVRTLAQQGRREDLQPLIGELCDGMGTHFPLDVAVALRTLVITGFEEESLQVARALFPRADDPLSWQTAADVLGLHLPAEEWEELAAQHPQPEVEEMDLDPDAIAELAELTDEYEDFDEETDPEFDEDLWHRAKADVLSDLTPPSPGFPQPESNPFRGVGRNDPCPCGSGKKFKMCHQRSG